MPETALSIVEEVRKIVKERMLRNGKISCYHCHILTVFSCARLLAKQLNADLEIVSLGALLHDITESSDPENHHYSGAQEAEIILQKLEYPQARIIRVTHCIEAHRLDKGPEPQTREAQCVFNADKMAHIMFPFYYFHHLFSSKNIDLIEALRQTDDKLIRSWNKLIPEAKAIVKYHLRISIASLRTLIAQLQEK